VRRNSRAPLVVFGVVEVFALAWWLDVGRARWFYIDEWDFLAGRTAGSAHDLLRPHNGHWTTLPVLVYRGLFNLFGLWTYLPYRVVIVVLYLVAAALLLVVMRRAGVHPWIATAAASFFALFGAGWENIILPFQIAFTGALVFGLAALLVTDHDGPFDRRDAWGLSFGLLGLMCSAVGVVMVAVVGAALLLRRGRRAALLHVLPLAACYALWLFAYGRSETGVGKYTAADVVGFVRTGFVRSFEVIGPAAAFGWVVALLLAGGLAVAARNRRGSGRLEELAVPLALLVGACGLLAVTAVNRASFGADWARQSRYVSLVAAMTLPALAVAADAIARRWRAALPFAIALFVVGIPANLHDATSAQGALNERDRATRETMLSLPTLALAHAVPPSVQPDPATAGPVTIGWLRAAAARHRLPEPPPASAALRASDEFRLSFGRLTGSDRATTGCAQSDGAVVLDFHRGDRFEVFGNGVWAQPVASPLIGPRLLVTDDAAIEVLRDTGPVLFVSVLPGGFRVCGASMTG
jgi:hypothetical protein